MSETVTHSRRGRLLRFAAAFVVLLSVAAYVGVQYLTGGGGSPIKCSVRASGGTAGSDDDGTFELTPEQASNAATISAVGITRGMPERAVTIALATAIQESGLRNLHTGDRDSLGLFQQRPSAGWGTEKQVIDPVYASTQFYERLAKIHDYSRLPLTEAAQEVQHSGFPEAYAKHESDATLLAAAFTGLAPAVLTCPAPFDHTPGDPGKVRTALVRAFGPKVLPAGGAKPASTGGAARPAAPAAAALPDAGVTHTQLAGAEVEGARPEGARASGARTADAQAAVISVPVRATAPSGGGAQDGTAGTTVEQRGWELAHWAVARAGALHIGRVTYGGRVWSAADAGAGWQRVPKRSGEGVPKGSGERVPKGSGESDKSTTSEVVIGLAQ